MAAAHEAMEFSENCSATLAVEPFGESFPAHSHIFKVNESPPLWRARAMSVFRKGEGKSKKLAWNASAKATN
jgi:hypothetical protein